MSHLISWSMFFFLSSHMCFESSVSISYFWCRNDFVWFLNSSKKVWKSEFDRLFLPSLSNNRCMLDIYHQKNYLIFFKMIPYLLWLCHRGKGSISKYWIRSQLKSCKVNTNGHEESIKNMFFWLLCGVMSFVLIWSAHQQHEDAVQGGGTWVVHPILSLDHVIEINELWWNQRSLTISMKIHANQAPATSFVYVFVVVNVVNLLWD